MSSRHRSKPASPRGESFPHLRQHLRHAEALRESGDWMGALDTLELASRRFPQRLEALAALADIYQDLGDTPRLRRVLEEVLVLNPDDSQAVLALAGTYMSTGSAFLTVRTLRRFLRDFPDHPDAAEVRTSVAEFEADLPDYLEALGLQGVDGRELAELHEESVSCLAQGRCDEARTKSEEVLRRRPDFAPAGNNLSLAHLTQGRHAQAEAVARRVLDRDPTNFHALANVIRIFCIQGRFEDAHAYAERLKAVPAHGMECLARQAEALSLLGDDAGVEEVFTAAREVQRPCDPSSETLLLHLAAVAALRSGHDAEARERWTRALDLDPTLEPALDNLEDLLLPAAQRHGPWAFSLANWLPGPTVRDLTNELEHTGKCGTPEALRRATRRFLRDHPEVVRLVPTWLERGDPEATELAARIAELSGSSELHRCLLKFVSGRRGSDDLRQAVASDANRAGILPSGSVRMWLDGAWEDVLMLDMELHAEAPQGLPVRPRRLLELALEKVGEKRYAEGEALLNQALELQPGNPVLLNNLAATLQMEGRTRESEELIRQVQARHPDYLFAVVGVARLATRDRDLETARALLLPLLQRKRLHVAEFAALAQAQIELHLVEGSRGIARQWLKVWQEFDPEHPQLPHWRRRVDGGFSLRLFGRRK